MRQLSQKVLRCLARHLTACAPAVAGPDCSGYMQHVLQGISGAPGPLQSSWAALTLCAL